MSERQFKACDGDTWTEFEPGWLRLTSKANGNNWNRGMEMSIEDVQADHGPLTEIRPDIEFRALLADVLEELAEELRGVTGYDDTSPYLMGERLQGIFAVKARELREESS